MMKAILAAVALIAVVAGGSYGYRAVTEETVTTTITRTDRECTSNGSDCRYVVYTPNEVFENVDSWWYLKFNSTDFNNKLAAGAGGKQFELTVYGLRIPFFSWYRNVVDYREVQ